MNTPDGKRTDRATEIKRINVDGTRLHVAIQQGDATRPPLLLINGVGANLELFTPFIGALDKVAGTQKIGTLRFDIPGVGGSPMPLFPFSFQGLARLTARLMDSLGVQHVDVLGISWGGGLAQQFAYQYPQRCRRLVLAATSTGAISVPGKPDVLVKLLNPHHLLRLSDWVSIIDHDGFQGDPELARTYAQLVKVPNALGYYWQILAGTGWTSIGWLHRLRQPTLILAGDNDPIVPLANARIMARYIPRATLRVVKGGHLFLLSRAPEVAPVVHRFLTTDD